MRLWMIANLKTFEILKRDGRLTADGRRAMRGHQNRDAYRWMAEQMRKHLGPPPRGIAYPLWAWACWGGENQRKPDLRSYRHNEGPGTFARLEIEVPDSRVLLSDFDDWHAVLNDTFLSWNEAEDEAFDQKEDQFSEEVRYAEIEASWNRIFDLGGGDPMWRGPTVGRRIQATFWSLEWDDVVGSRLFQGVNKINRQRVSAT